MDRVSQRRHGVGVRIKIPKRVVPARTIETIPEVLKYVRGNNKTGRQMTQGDAARLLKVPRVTYRSWESGLRQPSSSAVTDLEGFVRSHLPASTKFEAKAPAKKMVAKKKRK